MSHPIHVKSGGLSRAGSSVTTALHALKSTLLGIWIRLKWLLSCLSWLALAPLRLALALVDGLRRAGAWLIRTMVNLCLAALALVVGGWVLFGLARTVFHPWWP